MEFQFHFKGMPRSQRLTQLAQAEFESIGTLVLKETFWNVHFDAKKKSCAMEVYVRSPWGAFKATSQAHDFMAALAQVSHKLEAQILRKKNRIQAHKVA